ncbi:hypothetical protein CVT25_010927 [Psilocybe cyanescens]|uniref:Uncharacterized protein n=1 Tax=Psilocybe cyanescens TaxID=93625 RepID=A0A409WFR4_PSICY|nr:hypothetical protein CVT25_010927 [Psilocybe cyanescens]
MTSKLDFQRTGHAKQVKNSITIACFSSPTYRIPVELAEVASLIRPAFQAFVTDGYGDHTATTARNYKAEDADSPVPLNI